MQQDFCICLAIFSFPQSLISAGSNVDLIEQNWPFHGVFGRFDELHFKGV